MACSDRPDYAAPTFIIVEDTDPAPATPVLVADGPAGTGVTVSLAGADAWVMNVAATIAHSIGSIGDGAGMADPTGGALDAAIGRHVARQVMSHVVPAWTPPTASDSDDRFVAAVTYQQTHAQAPDLIRDGYTFGDLVDMVLAMAAVVAELLDTPDPYPTDLGIVGALYA